MDGDALDGAWTKNIPRSDMYLIVMEGVMEYFSKEQVKTCLNMLCDSFEERVVTGSEPEQIKYVETEIKTTESKPKSEKEAAPEPIINPAPVPAAQKRRRSHAR